MALDQGQIPLTMGEDMSDDTKAELSGGEGNSVDTGAGTLKDLFNWPDTYAHKILESPQCSQLFRQLMKYDIHHHDESFSGTGSAGVSLHMLHKAFVSPLRATEIPQVTWHWVLRWLPFFLAVHQQSRRLTDLTLVNLVT